MDTLILTLQLFTSLPIRRNVAVSDERLIRGVALWPVAGILIGLFDAVVFWLAGQILPRSVCGALVLLAELWMTRGFHLDGLCDTADAVFSSRSRERMLEIMKDSHIGTFGVVAAIGDLALKYLLIISTGIPVYMILAAPAAGKMVQGICMYRVRYPREKGLGKSYIGRVPLNITVISTAFGMLWTGACLVVAGLRPEAVVFGLVLCGLLAWLFKRHMVKDHRRHDGGYFGCGI